MLYLSLAIGIALAVGLPNYILTPEEMKVTRNIVETALIGFVAGTAWFITAPLLVVAVFFKR